MNKKDVLYLDAYKRLDTLLSQKLDCRDGISEYITRMAAWQAIGQQRCTNWNADTRTLKQLRRVRNQIAHENRTGISDGQDYQLLIRFTNRVYKGTDPLSRIHKCRPMNTGADRGRASPHQSGHRPQSARRKTKTRRKTAAPLLRILFWSVVLGILLWVVCNYLYTVYHHKLFFFG